MFAKMTLLWKSILSSTRVAGVLVVGCFNKAQAWVIAKGQREYRVASNAAQY